MNSTYTNSKLPDMSTCGISGISVLKDVLKTSIGAPTGRNTIGLAGPESQLAIVNRQSAIESGWLRRRRCGSRSWEMLGR